VPALEASGDRIRAPLPSLCLGAGEKKSKENGSFVSLGGGMNCNLL
jgi:hypothetical protein